MLKPMNTWTTSTSGLKNPQFKDVFYLHLLPELKSRGKTVAVISHDDRFYTWRTAFFASITASFVLIRVCTPPCRLEQIEAAGIEACKRVNRNINLKQLQG